MTGTIATRYITDMTFTQQDSLADERYRELLPTPPDDPVPTVVVGVGRMGAVHVDAIASGRSGLHAIAIADLDAAAREHAAVTLPGEVAAYSDPLEALAHAGAEACLIASPTHTHADLVRRAIELGLHVFCEKPLTLDADETLAIGALAERSERILHVGFWRRFAAPWIVAKAAIDDDAIGRVLFVRSAQWDAELPPLSFCDPARSGGLIVDCGVHDFDLVCWLTGRQIARIDTRALPLAEPSLAEIDDIDNALVMLDFDDRTSALVDLSRNGCYADDVRTELLGERGAVLVESEPHGRVRVGTRAGLVELPSGAADSTFLEGITGELAAFASVVRGDSRELPGARESARALRIARAAQAASASDGPVPFTD